MLCAFVRTQNGNLWNKDARKGSIKGAASAAGLPICTTAYTLRHSTITNPVVDGLDLLTFAQVSGTSVKMIAKHYGQSQKIGCENAIEAVNLNDSDTTA